MSARAAAVLALLVPALAAQKEADERAAPGPDAPRGKVLEWTSAEGKPYWYRLPKKLDARRPPALILMLHGTGMPYRWAFWNYPIANGQFRGDDVVVAPEGMTPGHGETFNFLQGKQDGDHIAGLIEAFRRALPIGRVYLYGHSQGAFFCYWFAGEHPELVDGIVAHAGNVLDVRHTKLAKDKVAIGILHGAADAVVPVECAHRTERIYREEGYRNVRKYVVEGLTEQSGHWPLPVQAGEMLAWLDQVTASTPELIVAVALGEIRADAPDLAVVGDALRKLAASTVGDELRDRVALVREFAEACCREHAAALATAAEALAGRAPAYGSAAAHFRIAERAFGDDGAWTDAMKAVRTSAKRHAKAVARAMKDAGKGTAKGFRAGGKALETAFLAPGYDDLCSLIAGMVRTPPKGTKDGDVAEIGALLASREEADRAGAAAANEITAAVAKRFRTEFAALLAGDDG